MSREDEVHTRILQQWGERLMACYAPDYVRFLEKNKDPFANPVGTGARTALAGLWEALVGEPDVEAQRRWLEEILKVRAVQELAPRDALRFVSELKPILEGERDAAPEVAAAIGRVDELLLLAFEVYLRCREQLWEIRVQELRNRTGRLLNRMQDPGAGAGPKAVTTSEKGEEPWES